MGANFKTPAYAAQKQFGADVQTWTDPSTSNESGIGFRCIGFRSDTTPTMSQLALPDEPRFGAADTATPGLIPENLYVKDNRWETVAITIDGTTTDSVAEGRVNVSWKPWAKTICNSIGVCTPSDSGFIYKLYRFTEPNRYSIRTPITWALGAVESNYSVDRPIDPLAVDSSGTRLYSESTTDGTLIATISNCAADSLGNCSFADLSTDDGGTLLVGKIYNYILVVEDAASHPNTVFPLVQRYRSPYFAGPQLGSAPAFRLEPRYRRASVFLVDEYHQQNQTRPQIMVHVPMDKSGLDHDFYIQKFESSLFNGAIINNVPAANSHLPSQGSSGVWDYKAAACYDNLFQTGSLSIATCGNGTTLHGTTATVQSKHGTQPISHVEQAAGWKSCANTSVADSDGKNYGLILVGNSEWLKAADWGDTDQNGIIEGAVNQFTGDLNIAALEYGASDTTTIRCHVDNNPDTVVLLTNSTGAGSTSNCRSRYGVADMIGNTGEMTNGQINNHLGLDNGLDGLWLGQSFNAAGNWLANTGSSYDLLRALPKSVGNAALVAHNNDYNFGSHPTDISNMVRGIAYPFNDAVGRWSHFFMPTYRLIWDTGFRCQF